MTAALLGSLLESSRLSAAHTMLRLAADGAAESVMAGYSRELWDQYDLLFLDAGYGDEGIDKEMLEGRAGEWLESRLAGRQLTMDMDTMAVELTGYQCAMEDGEFLKAINKWRNYSLLPGRYRWPEQMEEEMTRAAFCACLLEAMADAAESAFELEDLIMRMGETQEAAAQLDGGQTEEEKEDLDSTLEEAQGIADDFSDEMRIWRNCVRRVEDIWIQPSEAGFSAEAVMGIEDSVKRHMEGLMRGFKRYDSVVSRRWAQAEDGTVPASVRKNWKERTGAFYSGRQRQRRTPASWFSETTAWRVNSYGIEYVEAAPYADAQRADKKRDGRVAASYVTSHFSNAAEKGERPVQCEQEYILTGADTDREGYELALRMCVNRLSGWNSMRILEEDSRWKEFSSFAQSLTYGGEEGGLALIMMAYLLNAQSFSNGADQAEQLYAGGTAVLEWRDLNVEFTHHEWMELMLSEAWDEEQMCRCMSLIQYNMRGLNPCFSLAQCLGEVELLVQAQGRYQSHVKVKMGY